MNRNHIINKITVNIKVVNCRVSIINKVDLVSFNFNNCKELTIIYWVLIIYLVSLRLIPIIFLFGFSLPAYASAMLYNKFFQKLEDQLLSEQEPAPEISPEEDERVFHDELDESLKTDVK